MNTMKLDSGTVVNHHGDFSGRVSIQMEGQSRATRLSMRDLEAIVAEKIRQSKIKTLENAPIEELLGPPTTANTRPDESLGPVKSSRDVTPLQSLYRGFARFTKEQVIFVVEVILVALFDRIVAVAGGARTEGYIEGAEETAGMALATLYHQLNPDGGGMAIEDALAYADIGSTADQYVENLRRNPKTARPGTRVLATHFVRAAWGDVWCAE